MIRRIENRKKLAEKKCLRESKPRSARVKEKKFFFEKSYRFRQNLRRIKTPIFDSPCVVWDHLEIVQINEKFF